MTPEQQKVLDTAREWACERNPKDPSSKALYLAVARCFPDDYLGKEHCTCGEQDDCDECATTAEIQASLAALERELTPAAD